MTIRPSSATTVRNIRYEETCANIGEAVLRAQALSLRGYAEPMQVLDGKRKQIMNQAALAAAMKGAH